MTPQKTPVDRARRHLRWLKEQGWARLVEEDQLNLLRSASEGAGRLVWAWRHGVKAGTAMPVWVLGLQRSGTNMLMRAFAGDPRFEVYNENHRKAFRGFRLVPDPDLGTLIERCRHPWVVFKPLCDSHRAVELLDSVHCATGGRALWIYRNVDDRARSALAKFGDVNLVALRNIAAGRDDGWQAGGLGPERVDLIRSFDLQTMSAETAAALFWFLRNSLYFDTGLNRRSHACAVSYDKLVADPQTQMRRVCKFIGCEWRASMSMHISSRLRPDAASLDIDPRVRALCDDLAARLDGQNDPR